VITCANCGTTNETGSRFCQECGADLRTLGARTERPFEPGPSVGPTPISFEPPSDKGGRTWLWVLVGGLGGCILLCCLVFAWAGTIGEDTVIDWATDVAEWGDDLRATDTPVRRPPARNTPIPTQT
jgi:hypothetical protein